MGEEYLGLKDILPRINNEVTGSTLAKWAKSDKIRFSPKGNRNMYCLQDVIRVIQENPKKPKVEKKTKEKSEDNPKEQLLTPNPLNLSHLIEFHPKCSLDYSIQTKKKRKPRRKNIKLIGPLNNPSKPRQYSGYEIPTWDHKLAENFWLPRKDLIIKSYLDSKYDQGERILKHSWFHVTKSTYLPEYIEGLPIIYRTPEEDEDIDKNTEIETKGKKNGRVTCSDTRLRTISYRIYPDKVQKKKLVGWFAAVKWVYNQCVSINRKKPGVTQAELRITLIEEDSKLPSKIHKLILGDKDGKSKPEKQRIPFDVLDTAIDDFLFARETQENLKAEAEKAAKSNPHVKKRNYTMKYRSTNKIYSFKIRSKKITILPGKIDLPKKKRGSKETQSLEVNPAEYPYRIKFFPRSFGKFGMGIYEKMDTPTNGCRLSWNGKDVFMLHVPRLPPPGKVPATGVCSIDPGERVFASVYGSDGNTYLIGEHDSVKIDRLAYEAQQLRNGVKRIFMGMNSKGRRVKVFAKVSEENSKKPKRTRSHMRDKAKQLEARAKDLITDIHRKTVKFLSERYETIIIPVFKTQNMCKKRNISGKYTRKIGKVTSRRLLKWSHYKFRQLLLAKVGSRLIVGTEEYTSKTCGNCFNIHWKLGSLEEFNCPTCKMSIHRDINAARNIMLLNWAKA